MPQDIAATLQAQFGFSDFRPGQGEAIEHLLAGRHALVVMPTGAGKSLIYQLAALQLPGLTLVISPLIALMQDQVESLNRHGVPATCIHSALPMDEQSRRLRALAGGAFRLAYVAPERLRSTAFQDALRPLTISLLAVDEAHCISHWGHDFRPDYLHIAPMRAQLGDPTTAALTATATPQVQDDIVQILGIPAAQRIVTGFNRPNLTLSVQYTAAPEAKLRAVRGLLAGWKEGSAIVYAGTRRDAEEVAEFIREVAGATAQHYHAGLEPARRAKVQDAFMAGRLPIVVATNAFGMGIDRADVRLVAHYSVPGTLEAYYQEAGRAGRDGQPARAVLLYAPKDRALQEWFIEHEAPAVEDVRALYNVLRRAASPEAWLTTEDFSLATGLSDVSVKVGLSQLETAGSLQRLGDAGPRMLLRAGAWDDAAIGVAAREVDVRRRHRHAQLEQMIGYAESNACRRRILLDHFGDRAPAEEAAECCDNCRVQRAGAGVEVRPAGELSEIERVALVILDAVRRLQWEVGKDRLAQLLKGSRSRDMDNVGYREHIYYGRLKGLHLSETEGLTEQLVEHEFLKVVGGAKPVLRLTPKGEEAIRQRAGIALVMPRSLQRKAVRSAREHAGPAASAPQDERLSARQASREAARQAGGTVELTRQLFAKGMTPAQIAAQRGLGENAILEHLAHLIGRGEVSLAAVVPADAVKAIRQAIDDEGSVAFLAPIKSRLPEEISYGQIKCVIELWRREQGGGVSSPGLVEVILDCVRSLPGALHRSSIAKLLVGSASERMEEYQSHPLYARLSDHSRGEVLIAVDELIENSVLLVGDNGHVTLNPAQNQAQAARMPAPPSTSTSEQRIVQLGDARSPNAVPELIAALKSSNGNVRRLAASALGKIRDRRAVEPLMTLLLGEQKPQVRLYAVNALEKLADPRSRPLLEQIAGDEGEKDYTRAAARRAVPQKRDHAATANPDVEPRNTASPTRSEASSDAERPSRRDPFASEDAHSAPVGRLTPAPTKPRLQPTPDAAKRTPHRATDSVYRFSQADRQMKPSPDALRLTQQLFAQGLPPAKIAVRSGLSEGTIYEHLAHLIGQGVIPLSAVVPVDTAALVLKTIKELGRIPSLAAIKSRLPAEISLGQITCVVQAWREARSEASSDAERGAARAPFASEDAHSASAHSAAAALDLAIQREQGLPDDPVLSFLGRRTRGRSPARGRPAGRWGSTAASPAAIGAAARPASWPIA